MRREKFPSLPILLALFAPARGLIISKDGDVSEAYAFTRLTTSDLQQISSICGVSTENSGNEGRRYPWAVSFLSKGRNKLGGTIISPYHILTAAHGFVHFKSFASGEACKFLGYREYDSLVSGRIIVYGDDCIHASASASVVKSRRKRDTSKQAGRCLNPNIQYNKIRSVYVDESFIAGGCLRGHDWALVEVERRIQFSDRVRPICLPHSPLQPPISKNLMVVGWGRPDAFAHGEPHIREIPMAYDERCQAPWSDTMPTSEADYVCAHAHDQRDYSSPRTCHGDSGSGMEQRISTVKSEGNTSGTAVLMGIVSFGSKGCPANELARFTKVSLYTKKICSLISLC